MGLAVGDAVGAPCEGLPPDMIFSMGPARSLVETPIESLEDNAMGRTYVAELADKLYQAHELRQQKAKPKSGSTLAHD